MFGFKLFESTQIGLAVVFTIAYRVPALGLCGTIYLR